jgi:hypothetical protein
VEELTTSACLKTQTIPPLTLEYKDIVKYMVLSIKLVMLKQLYLEHPTTMSPVLYVAHNERQFS